MVARILASGVVPKEKAAEAIKAAFKLATESASAGKTRHFVAAMKIPLAAAALELAKPSPAGGERIGFKYLSPSAKR